MKLRDRLMQFMQGRYGVDAFTKFLTWMGLGVLLFSNLFRIGLLSYVGVLIVFFAYYRIFSKDHQKRWKENTWFLNKTKGMKGLTLGIKDRKKNKDHRIFPCPSCKQKIRVPKGKGRIMISCPKCKHQFEKKS